MSSEIAKVRFRQDPDDGLWYIILKARNGARLGPIGEGYSSKRNARRGWRTIRDAAREAVEVDG